MAALERLQKSLERALVNESLTNNPFILSTPFTIEVDDKEMVTIMFRGKPHAWFKAEVVDNLSDEECDFIVHHELLHAIFSVMEKPKPIITVEVDSMWAAAIDYITAITLAKDSTKH